LANAPSDLVIRDSADLLVAVTETCGRE